MKLVIGFSGPAEHGKSTSAEYAAEWFKAQGFNVLVISFADRLKEACKIIFRLTDKDLNNTINKSSVRNHIGTTPREILQKFGTEVCRNNIPIHLGHITPFSIWTWNVEQDIKEANSDTIIIIPDVRFDDELEMLKSLGCTYIVNVVRPDHQSSVNLAHQSERGLCTVADYNIINSGTLTELEHTVYSIISRILSHH